jgi:dolichol-phosphate mannosyltransferase
MTSAPRLTVVIPVLNEADNVRGVVRELELALTGIDWEVQFVDDDSTDATAQTIEQLARENPRVRLILRVADPGLAQSCIQGMLSSSADFLCVMDGDGQHDPASIPAMLDRLEREGVDLVSGARDLGSDRDGAVLGGGRTALSELGNALVRMTLRRDVRDPLTGFFVIRRAAFLGAVRGLGNSGFKLLVDILATAPSLRHAENPIRFRPRAGGHSKLDARALWLFAMLLVEKASRGLIGARVASFLAIGSAGLAVHMSVLHVLLSVGQPFAFAQTGAALTAVTFNFLFNNLLTFGDRRFTGWALLPGWAGYLALCSVGLVANVSIASWVYGHIVGIASIAALAGIALDVLWKFVISDRLLWRRRRGSG